jgi:hypothetical protein
MASTCENCRSVKTHVDCWKCHQGMDGFKEERRKKTAVSIDTIEGRRRHDMPGTKITVVKNVHENRSAS